MINVRSRAAVKAALSHFSLSLLVAVLAATLVFQFWFPWPYRDMAGGTELFWLIVSVDVVCGPLLTLVLFNPAKPKKELWTDLGIVAGIQLLALLYGLFTLWQVRPLYLPHEVDRFKVVSRADLGGASTDILISELRPGFFKSPQVIGLRSPDNPDERNQVLLEAVAGGRDYGERPNFYVPYDDNAAAKAFAKGQPLKNFLLRYPAQTQAAEKILGASGQTLEKAKYLPIRARKDWIAVLDAKGYIAGYLPGDGF